MVQRKGKGKCWKVCPSRSFITYLLITSTRESNPLYRLTQWSNNFTLEEGILTSSISSALWFEFQCEGCGLTTTVPHNLIQSHSPSLLLKLNHWISMQKSFVKLKNVYIERYCCEGKRQIWFQFLVLSIYFVLKTLWQGNLCYFWIWEQVCRVLFNLASCRLLSNTSTRHIHHLYSLLC